MPTTHYRKKSGNTDKKSDGEYLCAWITRDHFSCKYDVLFVCELWRVYYISFNYFKSSFHYAKTFKHTIIVPVNSKTLPSPTLQRLNHLRRFFDHLPLERFSHPGPKLDGCYTVVRDRLSRHRRWCDTVEASRWCRVDGSIAWRSKPVRARDMEANSRNVHQ